MDIIYFLFTARVLDTLNNELFRTTTQSSQCNKNFGASTKFRLRWGYFDLNFFFDVRGVLDIK